jgi:hypothetical protein
MPDAECRRLNAEASFDRAIQTGSGGVNRKCCIAPENLR